MRKFIIFSSVVTIIVCAAKLAWSDEIYVDGRVEKATCETLWSEPIQIRCFSKLHVCTFYPETGQMECMDAN